MTLLRSKILAAAGLRHAFPERGATDADIARELGLPPGAAIVQVKQVHGADAIDAARRGAGPVRGRARRTGGRRAGRGGRARGRLRAGPRRRRRDRGRRRHPRRLARRRRRGRAGRRGAPRSDGSAAAPHASSPRSGRASGRAASRSGATSPSRSRGPRTARASSPPSAATRRTSTFAPPCAPSSWRRACSDARIEDVPGCTKHETARFHSFRRDGAEQRPHARGDRGAADRRERMALMMQGALSDITKAVGNTPIVRLNRVTAGLAGRDLRQVRVPEPGRQPQGPPRARTCSAAPRRTGSSRAARSSRRRAATPARRSRCSPRCAATSASS